MSELRTIRRFTCYLSATGDNPVLAHIGNEQGHETLMQTFDPFVVEIDEIEYDDDRPKSHRAVVYLRGKQVAHSAAD